MIRDLCIAVFTTSSEERHHVISSVITSLVCIFFLVLVKILNEKYRKKHFRNIPIPGEAIVVRMRKPERRKFTKMLSNSKDCYFTLFVVLIS